MKKESKWLIVLSGFIMTLFTVFMMCSSISVHAAQTSQDFGDQFITHAELQDANGNPQTNFGIHDNMQAQWNFTIPAGAGIKEGDTMTVEIPSALSLQTNLTFDIKDAAGNVIGNAVADHTTGKITITFTAYGAQESENAQISGSFNVWVQWNQSQIEESTTVPVNWGNAGTVNINVEPGDSSSNGSGETLNKWGEVDPTDPSLIHWTVRVNYAQQEVENAILKDAVGANQELVSGSISGYSTNSWDSSGQPIPGTSVDPNLITEDDSNHFTVILGHLTDTVYIFYATRATDGGQSDKYENTATLTGDNIETSVVNVWTQNSGAVSPPAETIISVSGVKTWLDDNNAVGLRPDSITFDLYQNGAKIDSKVVTAADNWQYSFTNLPKYDDNGVAYQYTVKEEAVNNYVSTQDGNNFTNTLTGETQVSGTKTWVDNNDEAHKRPTSIVINLLANGKNIDSKVVTESDDWSWDFTNLPKYDAQGKLIVYTVSENSVPDYITEVDGYNVTNTYQAVSTPPTQPDKPAVPSAPTQPDKPAAPNTPAQPDKPIVPDTPSQSTVSKQSPSNSKDSILQKAVSTPQTASPEVAANKSSLPQTGEQQNMFLTILGLGLIAIAMSYLFPKLSKKDETD